jgi:hydroxyacylglutathione hydrolase
MYNLDLIPALMDSTQNYIYYLVDKATGKSAVIDPGDSKPILNFLNKKNYKPDFILNTHSHWDHVNGNVGLKKTFPDCKVVANQLDKDAIPCVDICVNYEDIFSIGEIEFEIIHTPGHLRNHIAFYSKNAKLLFCGDVMFSGGCGGMFEGTPEEMFHSFQKFQKLPNDTKVCCAHEYTASNMQFALTLEPDNKNLQRRMEQVRFFLNHNNPTVPSTILIERETNPFMRFNDPKLRAALNIDLNESDINVFKRILNEKARFYSRLNF